MVIPISGLFYSLTPILTSLVFLRNNENSTRVNQELETQRHKFQENMQFSGHLLQVELEKQRVAFNRRVQLDLAAYQRETTLQSAEYQRILANFPLNLSPTQIRENHPYNGTIPLLIVISPPQLFFDRFGKPSQASALISEKFLNQKLREFLGNYYPLSSQIRPTRLLAGDLTSRCFHGEALIEPLFFSLKDIPTLVLESEIEEGNLIFRFAYWGLGQKIYDYRTITSDFNCKYYLSELAKSAGREKPNEDDIKILQQFLANLHCFVASSVADAHHLIHYETPPLLPELLPNITKDLPSEFINILNLLVTQEVVPSYEELYKVLEEESAIRTPEFKLKLAQSLIHLSDKSHAEKYIRSSVEAWWKLHQLPKLEEMNSFQEINLALTETEPEYVEQLQSIYAAFENKKINHQLQSILTAWKIISKERVSKK